MTTLPRGFSFRQADRGDLNDLLKAEKQCFPSQPWGQEYLDEILAHPQIRIDMIHSQETDLVAWAVWGMESQSLDYLEVPGITWKKPAAPPDGLVQTDFNPHRRLAHLTSLATLEKFRRRGLGRYLLKFGLEMAREHHYAGAVLEVLVNNNPARRLYTEMGFTPQAVLPGCFDGDGAQTEIWVCRF